MVTVINAHKTYQKEKPPTSATHFFGLIFFPGQSAVQFSSSQPVPVGITRARGGTP